jgi:hypothetical protein
MITIENIVGKLGCYGEINLNEEAKKTFGGKGENPLTDQEFCTAWVKHLHKKMKLDYSYGGYMENRKDLWRDSYLKMMENWVHVGVDINVPENSLVFCPIPFKVLRVEHDTDQNGGWGTKVTVRTKYGCVIFAHLYGVYVFEKREYDANTCIGSVAPTKSNGGWFPHLHLQGISEGLSTCIISDGYVHRLHANSIDWPNPFPLLGIEIP